MSTESEVFALLDKVARKNGKLPSLRQIRNEIGGGSMSTISKAVVQWKCANPDPSSSLSEMPLKLDEVMKEPLAQAIWSVFRPLLNAKLEAQKRAFEEERRDFERRLNAVEAKWADKIEQLQCEVSELNQELRQARTDLARSEGKVEALQLIIRTGGHK